ncbi:MAG: bifunctional metallophosphatase/5'-nucleotidase [Lachnospiraceae bacterium]|nr:bifunctional metallophosphatase/5'-nucleotidase [Lachnospiraceae bacterium]
MKHKKYGTFFSALTAFCLAAALLFSLKAEAAPQAENSGRQLDVVFLHDTHSHLDSFFTVEDGQRTTVGGFARIKTLIDQAREKNPNLLVLDGGDFSMGTLVQTIYDSDAPELRMLGLLGCDVTTLGNHEFDYRSAGLAGALKAAKESGDPIPAIVLCNIDWETMEAEGLTEDQRLLKDAFEGYGMKNYIIVEKGDVRIAVFGIFGVDSLACAPTCVLKFRDASQAAAETVREIRENEDVDMIACVSHAGTSPDESKSEDEILAKAVPEIDLIISGHTHTALEEPILQGDTYIVSCGEYGKNLGTLSMRQKADGRWEIENYALVPVTPDITPDVSAQEKIDSFMEIVNQSYLSRFGYTRDQVLVQSNIAFSPSSDLYDVHTDHNLGNILADSFIHAVETAEDFDEHPVDVAIVPSGCVRDSFAAGNITVEDVFNAYSLGIGLDGIAGYPLISIYLTGAELKTGAEIDASVSDLMPAARLYVSGMHFSFNPDRLILNRVTKCYLVDRDGNPVEIQDDKLYRVVCDLYSGQMLGAVTDVSYRILSIQPKFADGTPIENIEDAIITSNGRELKAWAAIAGYMNSFPDTDGDGTADMPAVYAQALGSKTVEETHSLLDLIKKPNKYAVIIVLILLAVLALIVLLIVLIIKLVKKLLKKKKHKR